MEHQPPPLLAVREERVERGAHERERERGGCEIGEVRETGGNPNPVIYKPGRRPGYGLDWALGIFTEVGLLRRIY
jgi:hypothetical protein